MEDERPPGRACEQLDGAVVVRRPEPARDHEQSCAEPFPQRPLQIGLAVADDPHLDRVDPERDERPGQVRPVAVGAVAAHELRARDENRAARPAQPAFQPVGVTVITRGAPAVTLGRACRRP